MGYFGVSAYWPTILNYLAFQVDCKKLEHGFGMIYAGFPSFVGVWRTVIFQLFGLYCRVSCRLPVKAVYNEGGRAELLGMEPSRRLKDSDSGRSMVYPGLL